eukprot:scaffold95826_cov33-Tisochrysis_lutea.AAC.1
MERIQHLPHPPHKLLHFAQIRTNVIQIAVGIHIAVASHIGVQGAVCARRKLFAYVRIPLVLVRRTAREARLPQDRPHRA